MGAWRPTEPDPTWLQEARRPDGVDDDAVAAAGKLGEALEWVERARGRLYDFHQMMGRADLLAGEVADALRKARRRTEGTRHHENRPRGGA